MSINPKTATRISGRIIFLDIKSPFHKNGFPQEIKNNDILTQYFFNSGKPKEANANAVDEYAEHIDST